MYFLTVIQSNVEIIRRRPFDDFAEAVAACGVYYELRAKGARLQFNVEAGKVFLRAYAALTRPQDVAGEHANSPVAWRAAKQSNAFFHEHSYRFLIESKAGIEEAEQYQREDEVDT